MEFRSGARRYFRRWLTHWLTCLALSAVVLVVLHQFADSALFRTLDHLGADAVVRTYAGGASEPELPIVVVDLGPDPTIEGLTAVLKQLAVAHAGSVGVDFVIGKLPPGPDGRTDARIMGLRSARDAPSALRVPVAMPIEDPQLRDAMHDLPEIREASVLLAVDDDGVVRTTQERICTETDEGKVALPTLAAAVFGVGRPSEKSVGGCDKTKDARPIMFAPVSAAADDPRGIHLLSKENIAESAALLNRAYVIVGALGSASESDRFVTPIGARPGALVHAEAVRTLAMAQERSGWRFFPKEWLTAAPELFVGMFSAAMFGAFAAFRGEKHEIDGPLDAFVRLTWGFGGLIFSLMMLVFIGVLWTLIATSLVGSGVVVGAVGALFGSMLETLIHVGEDLVGPIHWAVECSLKRFLLSAAIVLFCAAPLAARAEECAYYITTDSSEKVESVPPDAHARGEPWRPFERVRVKANGRIKVEPAEGSRGSPIEFAPQQGDGVLVLPPCPPEGGLAGAWTSFWEALNPREPTTASGATLLYKGAEDAELAAQRGPLRELPGLRPATGVVPGMTGLALAWAGGHPPFTVTFVDATEGKLLWHAHTERWYLWLPQWQAPKNPFFVTVEDRDRASIKHDYRLLPPTPVDDGGVAEAIKLFETAPEYRMEALRRLAARSEAGEELAENAVRLIRVGTTQ